MRVFQSLILKIRRDTSIVISSRCSRTLHFTRPLAHKYPKLKYYREKLAGAVKTFEVCEVLEVGRVAPSRAIKPVR